MSIPVWKNCSYVRNLRNALHILCQKCSPIFFVKMLSSQNALLMKTNFLGEHFAKKYWRAFLREQKSILALMSVIWEIPPYFMSIPVWKNCSYVCNLWNALDILCSCLCSGGLFFIDQTKPNQTCGILIYSLLNAPPPHFFTDMDSATRHHLGLGTGPSSMEVEELREDSRLV